MIRGENVANPVLIVLHGGPGFSDTAFLRYYTPQLERGFTVVYWDQRGAGRSYHPTIARSSMTVAQFIADLDELVDVVRERFGHDNVALLGHSWGSALGVLYAARFPEKVSVYVGVAQVGDWAASEIASYAKALAEAERQHQRAVLRKLRAIGPPPHTPKNVFIERTCAQRLSGGLKPKALWNTTRMLFGAPESSLLDLRATIYRARWRSRAVKRALQPSDRRAAMRDRSWHASRRARDRRSAARPRRPPRAARSRARYAGPLRHTLRR